MPEPFRVEVGGVTLECVVGDIAAQEGIDAVVNAANAELRIGGGVAGAIHRAAGPELEREARLLGPITPGEAVVTSGHRLPNRWVIHCLGPVYGRDRPDETLLALCYYQALRRAEEHGMVSVAFPAISTGAFGYPMDEAARVALGTLVSLAPSLKTVRHVRFVLYDEPAWRSHVHVLAELAGGSR